MGKVRTPSRIRVQLDLSRYPSAILSAAAEAEGLSTNALAKALLEVSLERLSIQVGEQPQAERHLMRWVEETIIEYRTADSWDEHITLTIFDRIRSEVRDTYDIACQGRHRVRVNRAIGRLIRKTLGAVTLRVDGSLKTVQLPLNAHLIVTYTCLFRGTDPGNESFEKGGSAIGPLDLI